MNRRKRILIIDDEPKIVDVVRSYLEYDGYEVSSAYNGKHALSIFQEFEPDLVILDLMLPDLSGEEICRLIRKRSDVPIIMLTAKVEEENILAGLEIGADDYVTKPFSPRQLVARVAAVLRRVSDRKPQASDIIVFNDGDLICHPSEPYGGHDRRVMDA